MRPFSKTVEALPSNNCIPFATWLVLFYAPLQARLAGSPVHAWTGDAGVHFLHQSGNPYFVKLIEVRTDERKKSGPLKQRILEEKAWSSTRSLKANQLSSRLK